MNKINIFLNWSDLHQGKTAILLFVVALVLSVVGFFVRKIFFDDSKNIIKQNQKNGDHSNNIQIGSFNSKNNE